MEFQRHEGAKRSRGDITEQGGGSRETETRLRDGEDFIPEIEAQDDWRVGETVQAERIGSERTGRDKAEGVGVRHGDAREEAQEKVVLFTRNVNRRAS